MASSIDFLVDFGFIFDCCFERLLEGLSSVLLHQIFGTILIGLGIPARRPEPLFLQYLPCEIKVFIIHPNRKIKVDFAPILLNIPSKIEPESVKNGF